MSTISEDIKKDVETTTEPAKPKLIDKLKGIRWTFKIKNNWTRFVTIEPLVCYYMLHIFVVSLIEPYHFQKACVSIGNDIRFCDIITTTENSHNKVCAYGKQNKFYCDTTIQPDFIDCPEFIQNYIEKEKDDRNRLLQSPEDFRFCNLIVKTEEKLDTSDSFTGVFAAVLQFLVLMILSIWSDKYSKRKICLLLPLLGQLTINIITLHGALSTYLSLEFIKMITIFIDSLSGGMWLYLYGCFSYISNEEIRQNVLFRFGIITLVLTICRCIIPNEFFYGYYGYTTLISIKLAFNVICLLYVKVILNEDKSLTAIEQANVDELDTISQSQVDSGTTKYGKRKKIAKALSLDVIWDYLRIIFKERNGKGRFIIILFIAIILVKNIFLCDERFIVPSIPIYHGYQYTMADTIDIDGAIFIAISIIMKLSKISDTTISILVIVIPIGGRLLWLLVKGFASEIIMRDQFLLNMLSSATNFYSPLKNIAICTFLLAIVDRTETRIFLIVQAFGNLPYIITQVISHGREPLLIKVIEDLIGEDLDPISFTILFSWCSIPIFCGAGFLHRLATRYAVQRISASNKNEISERPWDFIKSENFLLHKDCEADGNENQKFTRSSQLTKNCSDGENNQNTYL